MREVIDGAHKVSPVRGNWRLGNWIIRQDGLAFGFEYAGVGLPKDQDIKEQLAIMNEINVACLLSIPDPMTDEGLSSQQIIVKERLDGVFNKND